MLHRTNGPGKSDAKRRWRQPSQDSMPKSLNLKAGDVVLCRTCGLNNIEITASRLKRRHFFCLECKRDKYDSAKQRAYSQRPEVKAARAVRQRRYNQAHKEKMLARAKFGKALQRGSIKRKRCFSCGTLDNVQGHHEDYSKAFDVTWLCIACHSAIHAGRLQLITGNSGANAG